LLAVRRAIITAAERATRRFQAHILVMAMIIPASTNTTISTCVMSQKRGTDREG
jgi:hypothetical protein